MKKNNVLLIALMIFTMITVACAKKNMDAHTDFEELETEEVEAQLDQEQIEPLDIEDELLEQDQLNAEKDRFLNENIHFEFNSDVLLPEAMVILRQKAEWIETNQQILQLAIEGHCDERGTSAYNMALGERRAEAVKRFLVDMGIDQDKFEIQSYGEERPLDPSHNEEAWSINRRAVVTVD
ncbi:MAG: OmpA family protein [Desulfobacteraceae bacterium]|nr:OmpA family protein [Desulfobacteraceae bacterium]